MPKTTQEAGGGGWGQICLHHICTRQQAAAAGYRDVSKILVYEKSALPRYSRAGNLGADDIVGLPYGVWWHKQRCALL